MKNTTQSAQQASTLLPAPTFPQAMDNNDIGPNQITIGALIAVPAYPGLQLNDVVTMTMVAFSEDNGELIEAAGFVQAQVALENAIGVGFTFFVPRKNFVALCSGHVEARYTINNGEALSESLMGTVNVEMRGPSGGYPSS